jgi:hypothetical protein
MAKNIFFTIAGCFLFLTGMPQPGKNHDAGIRISYPFAGYLKDISNMGLGAEYTWSKGRFGKLATMPSTQIGITFHTGLDYYFGEKETYGSHTVSYEGTTCLHAFGGFILNPCHNGYVSLTGGLVAELYDGNAEFGIGLKLSAGFYPFRSGNYGITPSLSFMKQGKSESVYAAGVKLHYAF